MNHLSRNGPFSFLFGASWYMIPLSFHSVVHAERNFHPCCLEDTHTQHCEPILLRGLTERVGLELAFKHV